MKVIHIAPMALAIINLINLHRDFPLWWDIGIFCLFIITLIVVFIDIIIEYKKDDEVKHE